MVSKLLKKKKMEDWLKSNKKKNHQNDDIMIFNIFRKYKKILCNIIIVNDYVQKIKTNIFDYLR